MGAGWLKACLLVQTVLAVPHEEVPDGVPPRHVRKLTQNLRSEKADPICLQT